MTGQHARISLDEAKWLYQEKVINSATLVLVYFRTGGDKTLSATEIAEILGINENTCRKAVAKLREVNHD